MSSIFCIFLAKVPMGLLFPLTTVKTVWVYGRNRYISKTEFQHSRRCSCYILSNFFRPSSLRYFGLPGRLRVNPFTERWENMLKIKSLRFKLNAFILAGGVLLMTAVLSYYYLISRKLLLENLNETAGRLTQQTVDEIERGFRSAAKIPENLASVLNGTTVDENSLLQIIRTDVAENDEVLGLGVSFEPYAFRKDRERYAPYYFKSGGELKFANHDDPADNYFLRDWYRISRETGQAAWSEPFYNEGDEALLMATYSTPIYRDNKPERVLQAVIVMDISLEWLRQILSRIEIDASAYGFLISQSGKYLIHPQQNSIMSASILDTDEIHLQEAGRKMVAGQSGSMRILDPSSGQKAYLYFAAFPSSGYSMGIVIPEKELYADLRRLTQNSALIGIAGLVLLLGLMSLISNRITRPLRQLSRVAADIGEGNFAAVPPTSDTEDEIGQLQHAFGQMQATLKEHIQNLTVTFAANEKIEGELRIAHEIQLSTIPKTFPAFPERDDVDIYAVLQAAKVVGGDLYDFFLLDEDRLCLAIGDVSGKGVPASLLMAVTRTLLRAKAMNMKALTAGKIVASMNNDLCTENDSAMFVTFLFLILDLKSGAIEYCNAGHNPPFIIRRDTCIEKLETVHGLPLGVTESGTYPADMLSLQKGESIVFYTDGVTEAQNEAAQQYEEEKLINILQTLATESSPRTITLGILNDVKKFAGNAEPSDDLTLLVVSYGDDETPGTEDFSAHYM